jgi:hypothetical protein
MTFCRRLLPREDPELDIGAPQGRTKEAGAAREEIAEFLDSKLQWPLYVDGMEVTEATRQHARQQQIEQSLATMSQAERVFIEIEMLEERRRAPAYTSNYDPLAY